MLYFFFCVEGGHKTLLETTITDSSGLAYTRLHIFINQQMNLKFINSYAKRLTS